MGTLQGLIDRGKAEEGYIEKASDYDLDSKTENKGSNNYTKYSRDVNSWGLMGCQGQPWCCTFQFWLEGQEYGAGEALKHWYMDQDNYVGYNCFATYNAFKNAGKVGMTPELGAVAIFDFSHAGRVIRVYSESGQKWWDSLEGNTSSNPSDRNGGQVKIKKRPWNDSSVKGFCYIDYNKKSGWQQEDGGWRFYLGNTGEPVRNNWYEDNGKWYWFDGSGMMVTNVWYSYKGGWYYLGSDGAMVKGQQTIDGKWYIMDDQGRMITEPVTLKPDQDGALQWPGLAK